MPTSSWIPPNPFCRTVLGDIGPSSLGITNAHEHISIRNGLITREHPDYRLDDTGKAIAEALEFAVAGGRTLVEATPCGAGRDPEALIAVSQATGVHVIGCTGVLTEGYYLDSHWRFHYTAEEIAALWQADVEVGMELSGYEGPLVRRSTARAGIVKAGSDYQNIRKATRVAFEAAAMTHLRTGVPILTHTETGTMMPEQVALLESLGVHPGHVILSHADRNPDWYLHRDVIQTGVFLEYDCMGRIKYYPESTTIDLLRKMFDLGLGANILLGGDNARRSYWKAYGGGPGISYMLRSFCPRLLREGFTQAELDQLLISNPARAFVFAEVALGSQAPFSGLSGDPVDTPAASGQLR